MLGEYKVGRCTRHCHQQQRPLRDGEWYYSVVVESGDQYERRDYSAESWTSPPENAVGWWKNRMPQTNEKKLVLAPPEVLVDLLRGMDGVQTKAKSRYLLSLMLLRKKILRAGNPPVETVEGIEQMRFEVTSTGDRINVPVCTISRNESNTLKDELNELLYCEAEPVDFDAEEPDMEGSA